jgi:hypothetical protein
MIDVVSVKHVGGYKLRVAFSDGSVGVHDFSPIALYERMAEAGELTRAAAEGAAEPVAQTQGFPGQPTSLRLILRSPRSGISKDGPRPLVLDLIGDDPGVKQPTKSRKLRRFLDSN